MEYIEGGSLARRLDGTPWSPQAAARTIAVLARAIGVAHRLGIVHRDALTPSRWYRRPSIDRTGKSETVECPYGRIHARLPAEPEAATYGALPGGGPVDPSMNGKVTKAAGVGGRGAHGTGSVVAAQHFQGDYQLSAAAGSCSNIIVFDGARAYVMGASLRLIGRCSPNWLGASTLQCGPCAALCCPSTAICELHTFRTPAHRTAAEGTALHRVGHHATEIV